MTTSIEPRTLITSIIQEELAANPVVIAEIGARLLEPDDNTEGAEIFHTVPSARVLAFEADKEACELQKNSFCCRSQSLSLCFE